jgi:flavin reductase (DIM6/NTAB) family NADH-FMN oxidoreductase RutF
MSKTRTIIPGEIPIPQLHQYLIGSVSPRPICFASTVDSHGLPNLAPFSFFNVFSANPPILIFAPNNSGKTGEPKHTLLNVKEIPEVVINMVNFEMVEKMNVAAAPWDRGVSEFEKAGFTPLDSDLVKPFRVAESPVQIECKVLEVKEMGQGGGAGNIVICQVLKMHISEEILDEAGKIDQHKIDLVGRLGGSWYSNTRGEALFQLAQPMVQTIGFDGLPQLAKHSNVLTANQLGQLAALTEWPSEEIIEESKKLTDHGNLEELASKLINEGKLKLALAVLMNS